jgi:nitrous oxide reductase
MRNNLNTDVASAHVVISGSSVVFCDGENLIDVLRNGQGVLNVLPLSGVKDSIDAEIKSMGWQVIDDVASPVSDRVVGL